MKNAGLIWGLGRAAGLALMAALVSCRDRPGTGPSSADWPIRAELFSGANAGREVADFTALGPKISGTDGSLRGVRHLSDRLRGMGYEPELDAFEVSAPLGPLRLCNVVARRPAAGTASAGMVVLVAHFDTKSGIPGFVGANDSGSGVGLLLELARVLASSPPGPVEVRFAFLDGEESQVAYGANDGLHGSRRLAARARNEGWAPRVRAVVVFDMVGDRDLTVEIPRNSTPRLVAAVFDAARAAGVRDRFRWGRTETLDDHVPFIEAGMPAVDVIDFSYGSAPGLNDYWHTPQDTLDKISPASLEIVGRSAIEFLRKAPSGWPE